MILKLTLLALLAVATFAEDFVCSSDTILRFGVEKRVKELQKDCNVHAQPDQELLCESTKALESAWKDFVDTADEYSKAVKSCREVVERNKQRAGSPVRKRRAHKHDHDDGHDHHDKEEGHQGHKHRRDAEHDHTDPNVDHTGHNHKKRDVDHDPKDPNVDHTGHNHRRRSVDHDATDPNIDHTGHNHRKRHAEHDPTDPNVDHTGHNHRRRSVDDPGLPDEELARHNHKRRNAEHDPTDPSVDHTGHNHRVRRGRPCVRNARNFREDGTNPCNPPAIHHVSQRTAEEDDRIIRQRRSVVKDIVRSSSVEKPTFGRADVAEITYDSLPLASAIPEQPSFPKSEARLLRARLQQVEEIDEADSSPSSAAYDGHDYTRRDEQDDSRPIERGEIVPVLKGVLLSGEPEFSPADIPDLSAASSETFSVGDSEKGPDVNDALSERGRVLPTDDDDVIRRPEPYDASSYSVIDDDDMEDQEREAALDNPHIDRTIRDVRRIRRAHHHDVQLSRVRRGDCSVAGNQELHKLQDKYMTHCERTNICLPDEDLGPNAAEDFKKLHKKHATTYANYVRELSACYGSLKN